MSCPDALCLDTITELVADHPRSPTATLVCLLEPHGADVAHSDGTHDWEHNEFGWSSWLSSTPVA